jgi:hypothetical protein
MKNIKERKTNNKKTEEAPSEKSNEFIGVS